MVEVETPGSGAAGTRAPGDAGQAARSSPPTFPILIGISGKRTFDGQDAGADERLARSVDERISRVFEAIERRFPHTPKVVVAGAAFGTDLIAADAALRMGDNWAVAAILPFGRALFEEDFAIPADKADNADWRARYAHHADAFGRVLGPRDKPNPRVLIRELPMLRDRNGNEPPLAVLSRKNADYDKTLRRNHYEQVGQFIAEISTIMIAVMGAGEQPVHEADGGTARVVAYRRAGRPDAAGTEVALRSKVLRNAWSSLVLPPAGYLWLIDPAVEDRTGSYPITVLPPLADRATKEVYDGRPGRDLAPEPHAYVGLIRRVAKRIRAIAAWGGAADAKKPIVLQRLRASLVLANGLERYHKKHASVADASPARATIDLTERRPAGDVLHVARTTISRNQGSAKRTSTRAFYWLAGLFLAAIVVFEIFAKFFPHSWIWLGGYLVLLGLIGLVASRARWYLWQPMAEDYRAVAEMLRVQRVWWAAGLSCRVDWEHLEGADHDLAAVREAAKAVIVWTLLRCGWPDPHKVDWVLVRGKETRARDLRGKKPPPDWIGSQLCYFTNNVEEREKSVQQIDAASWCLFIASGALGGVLWLWLVSEAITRFCSDGINWLCSDGIKRWLCSDGIQACFDNAATTVAGIIGFNVQPIIWLLFALAVLWFRVRNRDIRKGVFAMVLTALSGLAIALAVAMMLVSGRSWIVRLTGSEPGHAVEYAAVVALVALTALAGAMRYLGERLNLEAEALDYRDARERFARAERLLAATVDPKTGEPADPDLARQLVHDLGRLALAENEAWLKSRRERPLTPVVG